ncbi:relaxase [Porticoccus sp. W117]|uniref:relaxase/mobilization nuclease domain-containing protein n=1 Tax=Porticoccus sp. W117 TaxID=3054777 RepID=UPI0025937FCD|nr:relaxase [Porticoccus sp. W117]MDM3872531.1 relaxase [Porticoccus sp. W117]
MILQGSQRGGARDLALHLLKEENDHVEVHELRGFVSDDLVSALNEAHAISKGTKAKQFLFSLSLNPPKEERVSTEVFEEAIGRAEERLGLTGQPRAIVFHEKEGRRHAHAVWSRIDAEEMKAIKLPYTRYKLKDLSKELYLEHGWKMPRGFLDSKERDPKSFTLEQWQQAKRIGKDPREIKAALQDSWAISDTQSSFQQALKERGYTLARGDRRGFVALDHRCEIFSISKKWVGVSAKDVKARLNGQDALPSVDEARARVAKEMQGRLSLLQRQQEEALQKRLKLIEDQRLTLVKEQTNQRRQLEERQQARWQAETKARQERYSRGLRGLFDRITGKYRQLREQNEHEALQAQERDRGEKDRLRFRHLEQRQNIDNRKDRLEAFRENRKQALNHDREQYQEIENKTRKVAEFREAMRSGRSRGLDRER